MATKQNRTVPGLTFEITVTPKIRGKVFDRIEPYVFEWSQDFAIEWHENCRTSTLGFNLEQMRKRIKALLSPPIRGRR